MRTYRFTGAQIVRMIFAGVLLGAAPLMLFHSYLTDNFDSLHVATPVLLFVAAVLQLVAVLREAKAADSFPAQTVDVK